MAQEVDCETRLMNLININIENAMLLLAKTLIAAPAAIAVAAPTAENNLNCLRFT